MDFQEYDKQTYTSTVKSGDWCPQMIRDSTDYVTAQAALRDKGDDNNYITKMLAQTDVTSLRSDDWLSYYADIVAGAVQYGKRTTICNVLKPLQGLDQESVTNAIVQYGSQTGSNPADYDRNTVASTTIDVNSSARPWSFQYCTEYGWF